MKPALTRNTGQLRKISLTEPFVQFARDLAVHTFYYRNTKFIQYIFFRKFYFFKRKVTFSAVLIWLEIRHRGPITLLYTSSTKEILPMIER